jgi:hypothetical protein
MRLGYFQNSLSCAGNDLLPRPTMSRALGSQTLYLQEQLNGLPVAAHVQHRAVVPSQIRRKQRACMPFTLNDVLSDVSKLVWEQINRAIVSSRASAQASLYVNAWQPGHSLSVGLPK